MTSKIKQRRLRLILGDQLNPAHSWFADTDDNTTYLLAEIREEASYVRHHVQKICAIFAAMAAFAFTLRSHGHRVIYLTLDETLSPDAPHPDFPSLVTQLVRDRGIDVFEYQRPDEYRLLVQMRGISIEGVEVVEQDTEHFLVHFDDLAKHFKPGRAQRMEAFYRRMRRSHNLLMEGDQPAGGQWNFDAANRNRLKPGDLAGIPAPLTFSNRVDDIIDRLNRHDIRTIGLAADPLPWPVDRAQALELLSFFCESCLPAFGTFQDAMIAKHPHRWSLFHSRLSFAMNIKLLSPGEVIAAAIRTWESSDEIALQQVEGFVRQILGWREFIRGIYWVNMPEYGEGNALGARRHLPSFFWDGNTDMHCLSSTIGQSLEFGYAHHIQRLMITGNFCLLTGIEPAEVDAWYLGIYLDAFEWVEMPNTRGMSQFADGGLVGSKPYAAGGNYINRMSDYCRDCRYKVREKTGSDACPMNSLYWHFMDRHRARFENNPRTGMVYRNWDKQSPDDRRLTLASAEAFLAGLDSDSRD